MNKLANISTFESLTNNAHCIIQNIHEEPKKDPDSIITEVFDRYNDSLQRYNNLNELFTRVRNLGLSGWNASLPIIDRIRSGLDSVEEDIALMKERLQRVYEETKDWTRGRDGFLMGENLDDYLAGNRRDWFEDAKPEDLNNIKELVAYAKSRGLNGQDS